MIYAGIHSFPGLGLEDSYVPTFRLYCTATKSSADQPLGSFQHPPMYFYYEACGLCAPSNAPLLQTLWSLSDGARGILKGSWGVPARRPLRDWEPT